MKKTKMKGFIAGIALAVSGFSHAAIIDIGFTIDGDTFSQPWSVSNNSEDGILLESFVFDLRPLATYCYDTGSVAGCSGSTGPDFSPLSGNIDTGFTTANITNQAGGLDFNDFLQINFSDFGFGEVFSWELDVDSVATPTVYGNELIGSQVYAQMSDGNVYYGQLESVDGNSDAASFVISAVSDSSIEDLVNEVPEPSTLALFALSVIGVRVFARKLKMPV
ncbi:MAG: PEP-CTERM sorting domain-containing protein [Alteromonadaceae bacterium]|nr:PEP-CTERM sorting domain-containing protein [Alteromonadaceae bacterium]